MTRNLIDMKWMGLVLAFTLNSFGHAAELKIGFVDMQNAIQEMKEQLLLLLRVI